MFTRQQTRSRPSIKKTSFHQRNTYKKDNNTYVIFHLPTETCLCREPALPANLKLDPARNKHEVRTRTHADVVAAMMNLGFCIAPSAVCFHNTVLSYHKTVGGFNSQQPCTRPCSPEFIYNFLTQAKYSQIFKTVFTGRIQLPTKIAPNHF